MESYHKSFVTKRPSKRRPGINNGNGSNGNCNSGADSILRLPVISSNIPGSTAQYYFDGEETGGVEYVASSAIVKEEHTKIQNLYDKVGLGRLAYAVAMSSPIVTLVTVAGAALAVASDDLSSKLFIGGLTILSSLPHFYRLHEVRKSLKNSDTRFELEGDHTNKKYGSTIYRLFGPKLRTLERHLKL